MEGIKYRLSELMKPYGRGGGKSVRARGMKETRIIRLSKSTKQGTYELTVPGAERQGLHRPVTKSSTYIL